MQIFRFFLIIFCIKYHKIGQSSDQNKYHRKGSGEYHQYFSFMKCFVFHNKKIDFIHRVTHIARWFFFI